MLTENTVTKLQEMHLSAMAKAFKDQLTDPNIADLSFEDRFGLLVDHEWTTRKSDPVHGITLPAKFRIRRSGRSSALPYPPLRLKALL